MVHAALLHLMLEAANAARSTISLKRSTHIRQQSTRRLADYPICWTNNGQRSARRLNGSAANDPGRVKTRSVLFVGGVSGDPGGIVRLGAANSAELVRADA